MMDRLFEFQPLIMDPNNQSENGFDNGFLFGLLFGLSSVIVDY